MPGNEHGDRVHNFFAQDNASQGQHPSRVVEGNWPALSNNFWVDAQRQNDINNKHYNSQNSEIDRGPGSYSHHASHGLNFPQSNLRPDFARSQSLNEQPNLNGFMNGNQFHHARQNEANFLAVDTDSDQRRLMTSRGLSFHELQQGSGPDHQAKASVRSETSVTPVSFDLFGGQQQTNHQHSSILQPLQRQQSGLDMQQLQQHQHQQQQQHQHQQQQQQQQQHQHQQQQQQQQLMIRKMQELQRQQQFQQLDLRQQDLINHVPPPAKQASGGHPTLVNGPPNSDTIQYPGTAEIGANWLNWGSQTMQGSPNRLVFPPNLGQTQRLVGLVPQQVDQSLYGVPVSSSRGLSVNQYSHMMTDRSSLPQMPIPSNSFQVNLQNLLPNQVGEQDESSIHKQKLQNENMLGHSSSQSLNAGIRTIGGLQQMNSLLRNASQQDFHGRQELTVRADTLNEKLSREVTSSRNEDTLDPTEEKILFGSDDNIWSAFGKIPDMSGEAGFPFDHSGMSTDIPSIQSGSWSALMQSAVAETSSSDVVPQEEWSGLIFHNNDGPSSTSNQPPSVHNDSGKQETSFAGGNMQMPSAVSSGSIPHSEDINSNNVMRMNQYGHKFQKEPGQRLQADMSQKFVPTMEEASNWSSHGSLQNSVTEGTQKYRNASHHPVVAVRNAKTNSSPWATGQTVIRQQPNGWNARSPGGDSVLNNQEAEKQSQNSQHNQNRVKQGEVSHGNSLWKSNSVESGPVKSTVGNTHISKGILSLNDAASVPIPSDVVVGDETSPFVQNNYLLNHWKNANASTKSQGGASMGRMLHQVNEPNQNSDSMNNHDKEEVARHEMDNCDTKENSSDSHRSKLSQHTSGGFRESELSDGSDSRYLHTGKQKSSNQLTRIGSVPQEFDPMGNLDEHVESTYAMKQPTHVQAVSQQNTHFGQPNFFCQVPRNSTVVEKDQTSEFQRENKGPDEEPSLGSLPGYEPSMSTPFSRPFAAYPSNKTSSSSHNMLELLHKVDQSRDHGALMQFSPSEGKTSSQLPKKEEFDGLGRFQHNQSSVSQGFGLQLGPPSQRHHIPDHPLSPQNAQGTFMSSHYSHAAAEFGEKGRHMVPTPSVRSSHFADREGQVEFKNRSASPGHTVNENSLYKMPGNFPSGSSSGIPYSRNHLQRQQIARVSGQMSMNQQSDSSNRNASCFTQRGSAENVLPDAFVSTQQDNLASSEGKALQSASNDLQEIVPAATIPNRNHMRTSSKPAISRQGDSSQTLQNTWTNIPTRLDTLGAQFQKVSSHFPESVQPNIVESSSALLTQGHVNLQASVDGEEKRLKESSSQPVASVNSDPVPKTKESLGKSSSTKNYSDDSPANSASTQKDFEAFGRSLKPNSFSHQNYSLLNQIQGLKDAESDPTNRIAKRMKGPDNNLDAHDLKAGQQSEHNAVVGDLLGSGTDVASEDSGVLSFSRPTDILQRNISQHGNMPSQDVRTLGWAVSQSNSSSDYVTSAGVGHPQVSPQMAPSWFNQYGTFKNGQMLPLYDAHKVTPLRPGELHFTPAKSSSGFDTLKSEDEGTAVPMDSCPIGNNHVISTPSSVANGPLSSQSSQPNLTRKDMVILGPKKRRNATSELHSWHKVISEDSQNHWTLSVAEVGWSEAANRLTLKVKDDTELIEIGPPVLRSKRRLILTTQLMQQLLHPAPAAILSDHANSSYESVAYAVSRIALGDACNTVSRSRDLEVSRDDINIICSRHPGKGKLSERNGHQRFVEVTEMFTDKARKLEDDFLRLDKSVSVLDLRVECQDLEKFSVINRFARFHGRGQTDSAETTSTDVTATTQKPIPQRYVTALPIPKSLPDGVQCLSL